MRVLPLAGSHDRLGFNCGRQELNDWLRQVARQHQDKGLSKTFVAIREEEPARICGYYALTLAELENRHLPDAWRRKLPRRIPGVRLGRLAVDRQYQGKGLGELLLIDALTRARRIYAEAGGIGLFVDALDEQAAEYYRRFGLQSAPDNPLLLFLTAQAEGEGHPKGGPM
jgi:GNAT superfamily N-acetyltransferase